ncbi:MAG: PH domain-containing protein [Planctomycetota bacterium]
MHDTSTLRTATFSQGVKPYFMLRAIGTCIISIIGIPLLPIVFILGYWLIQKYLDNLSCVLTDRTLELKRGILNKTESTIPLEKITDLQMFQGPVMRYFGVHGFKVETAGQTVGVGSLMSVIGIENAPEFRQGVLAQRDALHDGPSSPKTVASPTQQTSPSEIAEIRDAILRIEKLLESKSEPLA